MTTSRAVVWIDHQAAKLLQLDETRPLGRTIRAHPHPTAQHGSEVRTSHEFYADVCDTLGAAGQVLVTGSHTALADFRHYAEKHRSHTAALIVAYVVVDHPSDNQLVALARQHFIEHDRMAGIPTTG